MNLKSLITTITESLGWHQQRCVTFSSLVFGIINQSNVQHHALSLGFHNNVGSLKSKLERIRRFFAGQIFDYEAFAKSMIMTIFKEIPKMHIIIDRTNWKFGKKDINYLVLAGRIGEVTFPLFWNLLEHQGCSDAQKRIELMEQFRRTFGFNKVLSLTADREFIGADWLNYLCQYDVPFFIRIKDNRLVPWGSQNQKLLKDFFSHLSLGQERPLYTTINDNNLLVIGKRIKDEMLVVCSNVKNPKKILKTYKKRWCIETCFKNMKTQGFNLENTHMTLLPRLKKLMAVVAVAILISCLSGITQKCSYKKTILAPLYSIFTRGFRLLKHHIWEIDIGYILRSFIFLRTEG